MARPVSSKATIRVSMDKTVIADLDEMHWVLRKGISEIVQSAVIDYLAKHAPRPEE